MGRTADLAVTKTAAAVLERLESGAIGGQA